VRSWNALKIVYRESGHEHFQRFVDRADSRLKRQRDRTLRSQGFAMIAGEGTPPATPAETRMWAVAGTGNTAGKRRQTEIILCRSVNRCMAV
jgi:hypothetical protein